MVKRKNKKDRRAHFSLSESDGNGGRNSTVSINLGVVQGIFALLIAVGTVGGGVLYGIDRATAKLAEDVSSILKPEMANERNAAIEAAITLHHIEAMNGFQPTITALEKAVTKLESEAKINHDLLWMLYRERFGDRPPQPSPYRDPNGNGES